mmetsp:Transcript_25188/g.41646  ORF Transcript_25188/g.41646 Transcript_25188/m.41646 type:complete len:409 (+) Transcript_25188:225-1451(+)
MKNAPSFLRFSCNDVLPFSHSTKKIVLNCSPPLSTFCESGVLCPPLFVATTFWGKAIIHTQPIPVLNRVVAAAARGVEQPAGEVEELVGERVVARRLPLLVLVVRVRALLHQQRRDLAVAVLAGHQQRRVPEVVRLVQVEHLALVGLLVGRAEVLHVGHAHQGGVELPVGQRVQGFGNLLELPVPHPSDDLLDVQRVDRGPGLGGGVVGAHGGGGQRAGGQGRGARVAQRRVGRIHGGVHVGVHRAGPRAAAAAARAHLAPQLLVVLELRPLQPGDEVEDLLAVQAVLDAEGVLEVVVVQVVQELPVHRRVHKGLLVLRQLQRLEPARHVPHGPGGHLHRLLAGQLPRLQVRLEGRLGELRVPVVFVPRLGGAAARPAAAAAAARPRAPPPLQAEGPPALLLLIETIV